MKLPIVKSYIGCIVALLSISIQAQTSGNPGNESEIVFEAASGEKVAALKGWLEVPENRQKADSRKIKLNYVRFLATEPSSRNASPIVYLAGGPGGSGITAAKHQRFQLFMAMREFGDVIALDQRGIDEGRLPCQSSVQMPRDKAVDDDSYIALHRKALHQCMAIWKGQGVDIYGYTTRENALDLDSLRKHLRAEKITLWGISYGSHLALAALKELNSKIDRVVIASVEGLDQTIKLPLRTDKYFNRLQSAVNQVPALKVKYPKIRSLIKKIHSELDEKPLNLAIRKGDKTAKLVFQKRDMQSLAASMIADPQGALFLLDIYRELADDKYDLIEGLLSQHVEPEMPIAFSGMSVAMDIASGISEPRLKKVRRQVKRGLLADQLNFGLHHFNDIPGLDLGDDFRAPPISEVPTLVLSGTLDGRTYPESQAEAISGLSNANIVHVVNAGHNLFMTSDQVTDVILRFMRDETVGIEKINVDLLGATE